MADKTFWDEVWKPVVFDGIDPDEKYEISNYDKKTKSEERGMEDP